MKKLLSGLFFSLWSSLACAGVTCTVPFNLQNNTVADATQVMANYNALIACLANAAAAGVNSDITALLGLTTPLGPTFGGTTAFVGGTSSGTNAQLVSATPNGFTLTNGNRVNFTVGSANTGAATLNVNSTGVANFLRQTPNGPIAMTGGELVAGQRVTAIVSGGGTQYELETPGLQVGGLGPLATIASASTTDLGTAPNHFIAVSGVATINSFGSSANTVYPHYLVVFQSTATLINSGSLVLPSSANIVTAANDTAVAVYLGAGTWQILQYQRATGVALVQAGPAPTVQRFITGTAQTYTPTAGMIRIRVRMAGGGGGGGARTTNNGSVGTDTSFGTWTAIHGNGGVATGGNGGAGGTGGVDGTGTKVVRLNGGSGAAGGNTAATAVTFPGAPGGNNPLGGAGAQAGATGGGENAQPNTGAGGQGGGSGTLSAGAGGGAGEYVEFWMTAAQVGASQTYTVGAGGNGGAAGGLAGGNGAAGIIVIEEFYQ